MVTVDVAVTVAPFGPVPEAVPVLVTLPLLTSACVVVYVAVHVLEAPGASVLTAPQSMSERPGSGSVTPTDVKVTLPVFVTR
jgi:hypothetical protein